MLVDHVDLILSAFADVRREALEEATKMAPRPT